MTREMRVRSLTMRKPGAMARVARSSISKARQPVAVQEQHSRC